MGGETLTVTFPLPRRRHRPAVERELRKQQARPLGPGGDEAVVGRYGNLVPARDPCVAGRGCGPLRRDIGKSDATGHLCLAHTLLCLFEGADPIERFIEEATAETDQCTRREVVY